MANKKETCPSKIHRFIEVFTQQMEIDAVKESVIYLTDEELVFLINNQLEEKDRISKRTFERWKAANKDESVDGVEELDEVGKRFVVLYKSALIQMKVNLFQKMLKPTESHWVKWAWIIERKFDDWNIRDKTDKDAAIQQKSITIVKNYKGIEKK